jgi:hypothetical protein
MTDFTFHKLKFKRTWLGGSRKAERVIFNRLLDEDNDYENPELLEYRRKYREFSQDFKIVYGSWIYVLNIARYVSAGIAFWLLVYQLFILFEVAIVLSIITTIIYLFLKKKERQFNHTEKLNMMATNYFIKEQTGFDFKD